MNGTPRQQRQNFHGPKRQLLGTRAGHVPPAWRTGTMPVQALQGTVSFRQQRGGGPGGGGGGGGGQKGSKILLSRLPTDVREKEVEDLFVKTIGPLKESFLIYNSQGLSKGMAVITFHKPEHAILARERYDGKIVDGRRPIKIELVVEDLPSTSTLAARTAPATLSLLNRIAPPPPINAIPELPKIQIAPLYSTKPHSNNRPNNNNNHNASASTSSLTKRTTTSRHTHTHTHIVAAQSTSNAVMPVSQKRFRQKKGPKRIKKVLAVTTMATTVEQLDKEMEEYRAAAQSMDTV